MTMSVAIFYARYSQYKTSDSKMSTNHALEIHMNVLHWKNAELCAMKI